LDLNSMLMRSSCSLRFCISRAVVLAWIDQVSIIK
jgi:hypothetical protein